MKVTKTIIASNYLVTVTSLLSTLLVLPFFSRFLGSEWFAVLLFSTSIMAMFYVLDFGLSATIKRLFALDVTSLDKYKQLRTAECCLLLIVIVSGIVYFGFYEWVIEYFYAGKNIYLPEVIDAFSIFFFVVTTQLFFQLFASALIGANKQVLANTYRILFVLVRNVLVIFLLYMEPKLSAIFIWQSIAGLVFIFFIRASLFSELQVSTSRKVSIHQMLVEYRVFRKYSFNMFMITVISLVTMLSDKLVLNKYLSLSSYGIYGLTFLYAHAIVSFTTPIGSSYFPIFASLSGRKENDKLAKQLFNACQLSVIIGCCTAVALVKSQEYVYSFWIGNIGDAYEKSSTYLFFLVCGCLFQALQVVLFNFLVALKEELYVLRLITVTTFLLVVAYLYTGTKEMISMVALSWALYGITNCAGLLMITRLRVRELFFKREQSILLAFTFVICIGLTNLIYAISDKVIGASFFSVAGSLAISVLVAVFVFQRNRFFKVKNAI